MQCPECQVDVANGGHLIGCSQAVVGGSAAEAELAPPVAGTALGGGQMPPPPPPPGGFGQMPPPPPPPGMVPGPVGAPMGYGPPPFAPPGVGGYPPPGYPGAPGGYGPQYYPVAYPGYAPPAKYNGMAIASLVCSVGGFVTLLLPCILGVIFGFVSLNQLKRNGGREQGRGLAIAGVIVGFVGVAILIFYVVAIIVAVNSNPNNGGG